MHQSNPLYCNTHLSKDIQYISSLIHVVASRHVRSEKRGYAIECTGRNMTKEMREKISGKQINKMNRIPAIFHSTSPGSRTLFCAIILNKSFRCILYYILYIILFFIKLFFIIIIILYQENFNFVQWPYIFL